MVVWCWEVGGGGGVNSGSGVSGPPATRHETLPWCKNRPFDVTLTWRHSNWSLASLRHFGSPPPPHPPPPPPSPPSRPPLRHRLALSEGAHVCVFTRGFRLFVHLQKRQRHRWVAWWRLHPSATVKQNPRTVRGRLLASRWMYSLLWAPLKDLLTGD